MQTECRPKLFEFEAVGRRAVVAQFDGGKLGARVRISVRRIHFAIASSCPNQHEFEAAYLALKRTFSSA